MDLMDLNDDCLLRLTASLLPCQLPLSLLEDKDLKETTDLRQLRINGVMNLKYVNKRWKALISDRNNHGVLFKEITEIMNMWIGRTHAPLQGSHLIQYQVIYNSPMYYIDLHITETILLMDTTSTSLADLRFPWYTYCPKIEGNRMEDDGNHCYNGGMQLKEAVERAKRFLVGDGDDGRIINVRVHFVKVQNLTETRYRVFDSDIDPSGRQEEGFYLVTSMHCLNLPFSINVTLFMNGCLHLVTWRDSQTPPFTILDPFLNRQMLFPLRNALHLVCDPPDNLNNMLTVPLS